MSISQRTNELFIAGALFLLYFGQKLFKFSLGIYMEECRDANAYLMALNGMVPYRDFDSWIYYGPFAFCVYPLIFKIFGANLFVLRISYIVIASSVVPLVYFLARRLMTPVWAGTAAFLSFVLIDVPYYTYNHILATIAGLFALLFVIKFMEGNPPFYLFFAGFCSGIAILVKPVTMGAGAFLSIFLVMMFLKFQKNAVCKVNLTHLALILGGALIALAPCIVYFAVHGSLQKYAVNQVPLLLNRSQGLYRYVGSPFSADWLRIHSACIKSILPYKIFVLPFSQWGGIFRGSYYSLLIYSPVIFPAVILLLDKAWFCRHNLILERARIYLLLFAVFSVFVCAQPFLNFANEGRSFTMQVPFILITYFLFLASNKKLYSRAPFCRFIAVVLSVCFIFYLSFLHYLRNPYLFSKRYTVAMDIERAKHIKVTERQKAFYEYLNRFLSERLKPGEPIAVIGYYSNFSFLLNRENIFADKEECVWLQFKAWNLSKSGNFLERQAARKSEDELISRIGLKRPKIIIIPAIYNRKYVPQRLGRFIKKNYRLVKMFGLVEIDMDSYGMVYICGIK